MNSGAELRLVFWEATVACNLECIHCRRLESSQVLSREDLSTAESKVFIRSLASDFKPMPVLVLSGGEPLKRPDIFELTRFAVGQNVPVALATNGTMINEALAAEIVASGVRRVSISLDGATAEVHDRFRQMPGSFDAAVRGFQLLKGLGMSMQLNAAITRHNVHQLDLIYQLALELGADSLHHFLLVPVGCGVEIKQEFQLSSAEYEETLRRIHQQALEEKLHIRPICAPHYFRILIQERSPILKRLHVPSGNRGVIASEGVIPAQLKQRNLQAGEIASTATGSLLRNDGGKPEALNEMSRGCLAGTGICFVSHKGEVFPCGYLPVSSGNVREMRLRQIWDNSETFNTLRRSGALEGKCGECEFGRICFGCRARAYEATGNFLGEEPNCGYRPAISR